MFGTFKADYDVHLSFTLYLRSLNALWIGMLQIEIQFEVIPKKKQQPNVKQK